MEKQSWPYQSEKSAETNERSNQALVCLITKNYDIALELSKFCREYNSFIRLMPARLFLEVTRFNPNITTFSWLFFFHTQKFSEALIEFYKLNSYSDWHPSSSVNFIESKLICHLFMDLSSELALKVHNKSSDSLHKRTLVMQQNIHFVNMHLCWKNKRKPSLYIKIKLLHKSFRARYMHISTL